LKYTVFHQKKIQTSELKAKIIVSRLLTSLRAFHRYVGEIVGGEMPPNPTHNTKMDIIPENFTKSKIGHYFDFI
jgi:hypothetical protein